MILFTAYLVIIGNPCSRRFNMTFLKMKGWGIAETRDRDPISERSNETEKFPLGTEDPSAAENLKIKGAIPQDDSRLVWHLTP